MLCPRYGRKQTENADSNGQNIHRWLDQKQLLQINDGLQKTLAASTPEFNIYKTLALIDNPCEKPLVLNTRLYKNI